MALKLLALLALCVVASNAAVSSWTVFLFPEQVPSYPPVSSSAYGSATVTYDSSSMNLTVSGDTSFMTPTLAHVHGPAPVGNSSGPLVTLTVSGTSFSGSGTLTASQASALLAGQLYLNVHSTAFSAGEIRGQIFPTRSFYTYLNAGQQTATVTSCGYAEAAVSFDASSLTLSISGIFANLTGSTSAAHIHGPAAPGSTNTPVATLNITNNAQSGTFSGTVVLTSSEASDFMEGLYYINIHTSSYGNGEIRGQLIPAPGQIYTNLTAAQAGTTGQTSGSAALAVQVDMAGPTLWIQGGFDGLNGTASLLHIHGPAAPGSSAGPLITLALQTGVHSGSVALQSFSLTVDQAATIAAGFSYFNLHTSALPGGELRGQILVNPTQTNYPTCAAAGGFTPSTPIVVPVAPPTPVAPTAPATPKAPSAASSVAVSALVVLAALLALLF